MSSLSYKTLVKGTALTGSAASIYTAPALTSAAIQAVSVSNPTAGAVSLKLHLVPVAGSATDGNLIATKSIPAAVAGVATVKPISEAVNHKLEPGMQLYASGNGMSITISGAEYVA